MCAVLCCSKLSKFGFEYSNIHIINMLGVMIPLLQWQRQ